ncbi:MAG: SsrA-binding protein SmpB [Victivallales bacterium]|nr:SsrA-binding protein SmpB [Victivallales bacterium]
MGDDLVKNKKAFHQYQILETFEAGIELKGTEVKSCRERSIAMTDAYVKIDDDGQAWLLNVNIAAYKYGNQFNHEPERQRRLLLHKREIRKISQMIGEKGLTVVPLKFYLVKGRVKLQLGVARGKSHADKRDTMRKRQDEMDTRRAVASRR